MLSQDYIDIKMKELERDINDIYAAKQIMGHLIFTYTQESCLWFCWESLGFVYLSDMNWPFQPARTICWPRCNGNIFYCSVDYHGCEVC